MQNLLKQKLPNTDVFCYDCVDSTNNIAKGLIDSNSQKPFVVIANEQSAGRGRQGKSFYSPKGTGIYITYVTHPNCNIASAVNITTAVSVAVCRAIESQTALAPKIKWVNDIYIDSKKACGILCEAVNDYNQNLLKSVAIGIGINVSTKSFPPDLQNAVSLNVEINKTDLICQIIEEINAVLNTDFSNFSDYYKSHSLVLGKNITYTKNGKTHRAAAIDIDNTGGLVVKDKNGNITTLSSGEITVRL